MVATPATVKEVQYLGMPSRVTPSGAPEMASQNAEEVCAKRSSAAMVREIFLIDGKYRIRIYSRTEEVCK